MGADLLKYETMGSEQTQPNSLASIYFSSKNVHLSELEIGIEFPSAIFNPQYAVQQTTESGFFKTNDGQHTARAHKVTSSKI